MSTKKHATPQFTSIEATADQSGDLTTNGQSVAVKLTLSSGTKAAKPQIIAFSCTPEEAVNIAVALAGASRLNYKVTHGMP